MFNENKKVGGGGVESSRNTTKISEQNNLQNYTLINCSARENNSVLRCKSSKNQLNIIQRNKTNKNTHTKPNIASDKRIKESKLGEVMQMKSNRNYKNTISKINTKFNIQRNATLQIVMWLLVFMIGLSMLFILYPSNLNWGINKDNSLAIGTAENPDYTINDEEDLLALSERRVSTTSGQDFTNAWGSSTESYYILLTKDLTMTVTTWSPIGSGGTNYFYGTFDGSDHTITFVNEITTQGVLTDVSGGDYYVTGLFGLIRSGGGVSNLGVNWQGGLTVVNDDMDNSVFVGGISGVVEGGAIGNSYNTGIVAASSERWDVYVGGITGVVLEGTIFNNYNTGSLSGLAYGETKIGGIVGQAFEDITNSYNIGSISGTASNGVYVGGIAAELYGTIKNSYNIGSISGTTIEDGIPNYVGGIVGQSMGDILNSYNIGSVTAKDLYPYLGGIVGDANDPDAVNSCYYLESCVTDSGAGGTAVSSTELQTQSTFADWDFTNTWTFVAGINGGYPVLIDLIDYENYDISNIDLQGDGTQSNPYLIYTATDLKELSVGTNSSGSNYWGTSTTPVYVKLMADIEYKDTWTPIGTNSSNAFYGTFDGGGHEITITNSITITSEYVGLFGYVGTNSTIQNLGVNWHGGLTAVNAAPYIGGIAGWTNGTITNCYNSGFISGTTDSHGIFHIGGIAGWTKGTITNCYNTSSISHYNTDSVSTRAVVPEPNSSFIGGIAGWTDGTVTNCYNIGSITELTGVTYNYGGIVGGKIYGTITNCYYLDSCVENDSGAGGTAVSSTALQTKNTFIDWDFYDASTNSDGVWDINANYNDSYPVLRTFYNVNITYQYDQNDNSQNQVFTANLLDETTQLQSNNLFTRPNYTYTQWTDGVNIYDCGSTITVTDDITLYPVWVLSAFTVTYDADANGGSFVGASGYNSTIDVVAGQAVDLSITNRYGDKSGWIFVGWNTDANATSALSSLTMPRNAVTLYAIYSKTIKANFYQINGTNSVQSVTIYNNATQGTINIPSVQASAGQTAVGWTTSTTDTTPTISGTTINLSDNANYYAIVSYTVTISYNGNGGSDSTASTEGTAHLTANGTTSANTTNAQIQLANNTFSRPNYTFMGWSTNSGATRAEYTAGQTYQFSSNTTLYAIWTKNTSTVDINITMNTPNANGIVIYIMNGTKDNYTIMTQIVVSSSQTVTLELMKDTAYTIIVSKPYIYTLSFSGGGAINNNSYTFMTANADTTTTQSVTISGVTSGSGFNNSIII